MNKKKIKKYFKILFVPVTMLLCLSLFLINTFAQEGYEINDNGNIESLNIANLDNLNIVESSQAYSYSIYNQILILTNLDSSNGDPYIYFNNFITLSPNTTYSMYFISNNEIQYCGLTGYPYNTSVVYNMYSYKITFTTNSNQLVYGFGFEGLQGLSYEIKIMIYEGNDDLDYFPYGTYYSYPQQSNFMEYLIGENYFSSGGAMIYQTNNDSHYWDREIYPTNRVSYYDIGRTTIGNYIIGKTLYLQNLTYDLIEGLKQQPNYAYQFNTTLSLTPSFNFANSSITYLNIPCKFINLDIYCPNGVFECSCYVGNGLQVGTEGNERVYFQQSGDYIHIDFADDDNRWLFNIEIVLNKSNNSFVAPSNVVSNTNDTLQWDLYQIGFDDGTRHMEESISLLNSQISELTTRNNQLVESNNVLKQRIEILEDNLSDNFGFSQVFFALADTPFKTVSNMLGFELFGVNLFNALIGFITVLACIWLLKKFL